LKYALKFENDSCPPLLYNDDQPAVVAGETTHVAGLGDMVAAGLSAIGITKDRVSALAGGDCGCSKRQQQLNELGRRIGIG
jgi:hypothetical protein